MEGLNRCFQSFCRKCRQTGKWCLVMVVMGGAITSCQSSRRTYLTVEGMMLGTQLRVVADVEGVSRGEVFQAAMALDKEMKASMSIFDENSLLSRLNRAETDSVDEHITANFELASRIATLSDGRYDVTVKPLVEAWGFAGKKGTKQPNIDSLLAFVGCEKVRIENGRLIREDERVQLDFNSVAKGYTVDLLAERIQKMGARNFLVDIGGEIRCKGVNSKGKAWRIGVETPFDGNMTNGEYLQKRLQLTSGGMATSGNYRRFYTSADGRKVAHTIDPRTGYSALSRLLSVTVVAETCAEADALGTMFLALGEEDAMKKVGEMPQAKVYFIFAGDGEQEYEEYYSPEMEKLLMKE